MADQARDRYVEERFAQLGKSELYVVDTSASRSIYSGRPVIIDISVDPVNIVPFLGTVVLAAGDIFAGIALEPATVALGDQETAEIAVKTQGELGFIATGFTAADEGKPIYMSDNDVLTLTAGANLLIGKVARVLDGKVYVDLNVGGRYRVA
jgi:hypothetical protein